MVGYLEGNRKENRKVTRYEQIEYCKIRKGKLVIPKGKNTIYIILENIDNNFCKIIELTSYLEGQRKTGTNRTTHKINEYFSARTSHGKKLNFYNEEEDYCQIKKIILTYLLRKLSSISCFGSLLGNHVIIPIVSKISTNRLLLLPKIFFPKSLREEIQMRKKSTIALNG